MRFALLARYRPTKVSDGRHGYINNYSTANELWGAIMVHMNEFTLTYRSGEDVIPDDVIIADSGCYKVTGIIGNIGAPMNKAQVERLQKPIFPDDTSCAGSGSG